MSYSESRVGGGKPRKSHVKKGSEENGRGAPEKTIFSSSYRPVFIKSFDILVEDTDSDLNECKPRTEDNVFVELDDKSARRIDVSRVGYKRRLDYAVETMNEQVQRMRTHRHEVTNDPNRLLEITLTTIVLMARGLSVPRSNYLLTELYLRGVKNEFGESPENIGNFLRYLERVKKEQGIQWKTVTVECRPNMEIHKAPREDRARLKREMEVDRRFEELDSSSYKSRGESIFKHESKHSTSSGAQATRKTRKDTKMAVRM